MFRRKRKNKTTDQLQANKVFSYHSNRSRSGENTGRLKSPDEASSKRPALILWTKGWLPPVTLVIIVGCLISLVVLGGSPRVRIIQSDGGVERVNANEYDKGVRSVWNESLNNLTKLTANTTHAESQIKQLYPELDTVRIELPLIGRRPLVTIVPAAAAALLVNPTGSYYISYNGEVLSPVNGEFNYTGNQKLVSITDQSGLEPKPGEFVLNRDQVAAIRTYINGLEVNNIKVKGVILPTEPDRLDITLDDKPYFIKFSFSEDPRQGIGAYLAAVDIFDSQGKPTQYVDVRVPEKIFYK